MALSTKLLFSLLALQSQANDAGTAIMPHRFEYPLPDQNGGSGDFESGTESWKFDLAWSDQRTVEAGTPDDIDLHGVIASLLGGAALSPVEVCGIVIISKATGAGQGLLVGGDATAAAYEKLFEASGDRLRVGPSGMNFWFSPLDGEGLVVAAGTADILQVASESGSVTYRIGLIMRSA